MGGKLYRPTSENEVFVRDGGRQEVFFDRKTDGTVHSLVFSTGPSTFERK